ncbi:MAG: DegQ family serine endoprotease [Calditrichaeota bacterium]|nr:MAG: DegQ family serine endoprotease [Calditrichota bacterium]
MKSMKVFGVLAVGIAVGVLATTQLEWLPKMKANLPQTVSSTVVTSSPQPAKLNYNPDVISNLNNAFISIAEQAKPSVVTIMTNKVIKSTGRSPHGQNPFGDFFDFFHPPDQQRERQMRGQGSGVIVNEKGYILTNNHVVADADEIKIMLHDGKKLDGEIVGRDPRSDIAVVKVDSENLTPVKFGDSESLRVGEWVMAIGSPLREGLANTVSAGIVSAKGRSLQLAAVENFIQTDAAINPGNSGGAMINLYGQLVGINTAIVSQSGGFQGIGFAVPINLAKWVMDSLIEDGKVAYGYLGILPQPVTEKVAEALKLPSTKGALINEVTAGTPAAEAGLRESDVIVDIDGQEIRDDNHLRKVVGTIRPGTRVSMGIIRDEKRKNVTVTLGDYPENLSAGSEPEKKDNYNKLGIEVADLTNDLMRRYNLKDGDEGVLITNIDRNSDAWQERLRAGDLILSVNKKRVDSVREFNKIIAEFEKGDTILLRCKRDTRRFFSAITVK